MNRYIFAAAFIAAFGCNEARDKAPRPAATSPAPTTSVTLTAVKWPKLEEAIAAHKGKVVVIDFWADFCIPCKEKFPSVLELQRKYPDGIVVMSVTVDDKDDAEKALEFLRKQNATTENYLLDETAEVFAEKVGSNGAVPALLVYAKDGSRAKLFKNGPDEHFDTPDVEALVKTLMK